MWSLFLQTLCVCVCVCFSVAVCLPHKGQNFCRAGRPDGGTFLRLIKACPVAFSTTDSKSSVQHADRNHMFPAPSRGTASDRALRSAL